MRLLISAATGTGVAVLTWHAFTPYPSPVKTTLFVILAFIWAYVGINLTDRLIKPKKDDLWF